MQPTKRFVIEPLLNCNIDCKFCYHKHKKAEWNKYTKSYNQIINEIDAGYNRGNNYMDITGGEPTIYEYINEVIIYANTKGIRSCIITNGIVGVNKTRELLESGIHGFLVSRHGLEQTHDYITNTPGSYKKQIRFLDQIKDKVHLRFNCVITKYNQNELLSIAKEIIPYNPKIVNFINFNPHHEWINHEQQAKDFICDMTTVYDNLNSAIDELKSNGIGVNVRYFPMCRISPRHYECICNDLQVTLDPYEWDYSIQPKTLEKHTEWNINCSNANEKKDEPCMSCDLFYQCGGINKNFYKFAGGSCIKVIYEKVNHINTNSYIFREKAVKQLTDPE